MDISTLTYGAPATEPVPIEPIRVDGMAYAKIIAGMMNVGYFRERPTADGGSERVIVAKLVFPGDPSTVNRARSSSPKLGWMAPCASRLSASRLNGEPGRSLSSPRCGPARHRGERSGNERRLGQFAPASFGIGWSRGGTTRSSRGLSASKPVRHSRRGRAPVALSSSRTRTASGRAPQWQLSGRQRPVKSGATGLSDK